MEAGSKDREPEGDEGEKHGGRDARKAGKAREKKDNWKERGDKKDAWKERRRKDRPGENEAGAGAPKREAANENASGNAQDKNQRGSALLNMLKANPPSTTRYTREELLSIGQLPASRVKPQTLNIIIDKENTTSPLLVKPKVDKASRRRAAEGEEEECDDGHKERRDRAPRADRGGRSDGEEEAGVDVRRQSGRRAGDRWKEEDRRMPKGRHDDLGTDVQGQGQQGHGQRAAGGWGKADDSQWDMPDANTNNPGDLASLADFTLGDIRKAEKSLSGGMSMKDYKASLRAGGSEPGAEAVHKEREDPFKADGGGGGGSSFFVEEGAEDEDVSRASRGFGKWFGSRPEPFTGPGVGAAWSPGALQSAAAAAQFTGNSRPSEPPPLAASGMLGDSLLAEDATGAKAQEATATSNMAGRSILSMLGRAEPAAGAGADAFQGGAPAQDRHGKLSVAELFHLAQGKELPPLPSMANARRDEGADGEGAERRQQREALQAAQQLMWAAAAKAQQPPVMPPGTRYPPYQPAGPCGGATAPPAFSGVGRGVGAGSEHLFQEAAYAQAMLGMGQAPWASPMPPGCPPFGGPRGYGPPQPYGPYGFAPGYAQLPRGPGFDAAGGLAQARPPPAPTAQPGYGRMGQGAPGTEGVPAQRPKAAPEKAPSAPHVPAPMQARPPPALAAAPPAGLGAGAPGALGAEAGEEDAGCSQS